MRMPGAPLDVWAWPCARYLGQAKGRGPGDHPYASNPVIWWTLFRGARWIIEGFMYLFYFVCTDLYVHCVVYRIPYVLRTLYSISYTLCSVYPPT